jgi:hypothetical protein
VPKCAITSSPGISMRGQGLLSCSIGSNSEIRGESNQPISPTSETVRRDVPEFTTEMQNPKSVMFCCLRFLKSLGFSPNAMA